MLSKEEAESKLFKIYHILKMDEILQNSPKSVEINIFEEVSDPDHLEHNWFFSQDKNKLLVQMTAVNIEKGSQYVSGTFAFNAAWKSMKGFMFNQWGLIQILAIAFIIGFEVLEMYLSTIQSYFALIPIFLIGIIDFLFFYTLRIRKKRILNVYLEYLQKFSDEFETKTLEEFGAHFFSLYTKPFFPAALVSVISLISLLIFVATAFVF